ncbi:autotransporter domain-containing protein [Babesia caballi]|uniref:Autotransporter domain-containing protein n=1 Tax=Babesia caballi TaxID=5871 RepID=A0AAV4M028_BABCB|nr:autotransporter domain-containing protein [Babesia caballi]
MSAASYTHLVAASLLLGLLCTAEEPTKGLNIDVNFGHSLPLGQLTVADAAGALLDVSRPVPYIDVRPNELESVNRLAEVALEVEAINPGYFAAWPLIFPAVMHDEYYRVLRELDELSPEEMLSELIAETNALEALKAELGAEESVCRFFQ